MEKEEILDVLGRWEPTGLLSNLPSWEKEELALLYDNITRVMLHMGQDLETDVYDILGDVTLPTTRRLYRRVGVNFNINNMMVELVKGVNKNKTELSKQPYKDDEKNLINPIVDFCVEFADQYEDDETTSKTFTKEQYTERVENILSTMRKVLLSEDMVSFVDRSNDDWNISYSDTKKSPSQTRIWNQKRAVETLHGILNETNQGI